MIRTGNELGQEVCRALGIDENMVHTVELRLRVNEVAEVTTVGYVKGYISEELRHYTVVKRAGWAPPWPPPRLGEVYYR